MLVTDGIRRQRLELAIRSRFRRRTSVCTENLIPFDCVTESPNVNGDDRAALLLPDPVRLAVQVEEPTRGRERGAPTSADRGTAEDSWSCPPQERRSLVLSPAVSMVS